MARIELDVDEMARLYRSGHTLDEIAERFDASAGTVRRRLLSAGVEMRTTGAMAAIKGPAVRMETFAALYRAGYSVDQLAERVGMAPATVYRRLRAAGVELARPGKKRPNPPLIDGEWCREMRDGGHSLDEIAEWLGVSAELVAAEIDLSRR